MEQLPSTASIREDIDTARFAAEESSDLRRQLRRRTSRYSHSRAGRIERMLPTLEGHGSVLRSHLKRSDHHPHAYDGLRPTIRAVLARLRYERRQIKKMLPPKAAP
jgi:hypothetical protein